MAQVYNRILHCAGFFIGTNPYVETAPKGCCIYAKTSKFFLEFFVPLFVARGAKPHHFQRFVVVLVMTL
jgi:hypothetical protein